MPQPPPSLSGRWLGLWCAVPLTPHLCALGWWFDACGPSNLNGIYYPASPATVRYNGMKWHYWKGPSHRLKATTLMIRAADF